ncbi:MAG: hypothetical protein ACO1SX_28585 [Actinomycetota bacterium]
MRLTIFLTLACATAATAALAQTQPVLPAGPDVAATPAPSRPATAKSSRGTAPAAPAASPVTVLTQSRPTAKPGAGAVIAGPSGILGLSMDTANEPRVELDLENAPIRDALKQLFGRAKQSYKVDEDVPDTARITVRARNVRLSTALELLLQDAGLGVVRELENGKLLYRIRKSGSDSLSSLDLLRSVIDSKLGMSLADPSRLQQLLRTNPGGKGGGGLDPKLYLRTVPAPFAVAPNAPVAIPYVLNLREQRSIFRCPHCKGQATVLRQQEQPKCEKCARPFQPGWQFCPADGAKRPAAVGEWKYCPFCSKKVDGQTGAGVPLLEDVPFIGQLFRSPSPAPAPTPARPAPPGVPPAPAAPGRGAPPAPASPAF